LQRVSDVLGHRDLAPHQALLLARIGEEEVQAGDICRRGYYIGQNASYNLKKLEEAGYVERARPATDRRCNLVSLTPKGVEVAKLIRDRLAPVRKREAA
jgi:DNA-binding MarR family transcriptional regulator